MCYRNRGEAEAPHSVPSWSLLPTRHKAPNAAQVRPRHLEQQDKPDLRGGVLPVPCRLVLLPRSPFSYWDVQLRALLPSG